MIEYRIINGVLVRVTICKPSKRKASARWKYPARTVPSAASNWVARERDLKY